MSQFFGSVYQALSAGGWLPLAAAFVWGIFSILLSPCNLVAIPLVVGYVKNQKGLSTRNALLISLAFSLGIFLNIALVGAVIASAGRLMASISRITSYLVSAALFAVGLHFLDVYHIPWFGKGGMYEGRTEGLRGALLLGALSGLALGPCTFAYMAPMLVITIKASATRGLPFALALIGLYGLGHCSVIVLSGTFTNMLDRYMNWTERSRGTIIMNRICGWLIIAAGAYFLYHA